MIKFYDTTDEEDNIKDILSDLNKNQDEIILDFFKRHPDKLFSPDEIHYIKFDERTPVTSVRRSITNLTQGGKLEKTNEKSIGRYGRNCYKWKLKI